MSSGTNKAFAAFLKRNVTRADLNKMAPAARMKALLQEFNASVAPTPRGVGVPTAAPKAAGRPRKAKTESTNVNLPTKKNTAQAPIRHTQAAKPIELTAPQSAPSTHPGPTTEGDAVSSATTTAMASGPVRDRAKRPPTPEMKKKPKTSPKHNANARTLTREREVRPVADARVQEAVALVAALPIARGAQFRKAIRSHVLATVNDRDDIRIDPAVDPVGKATAVAAEFLIAALPQLRDIAAASSESTAPLTAPTAELPAPSEGSVGKLTMDARAQASKEKLVTGQSTAAETHTAKAPQEAAPEDEEIDEETLALLAQLE